MALKKDKQAAGTPVGFEQEDGPAGGVATATVQSAPTAAEQAKADVAATTAVATVGATSVAIAGKARALLTELKNALPAIDFGVLPRLVGAQGNILDGDKKSLGDSIKLQLVSYHDNFVISPGDDTDEAKELVKYSKDGKTIDGTGQPIPEYVQYLQSEGYDKASCKHYVSLIGILLETAKQSEHVGSMVEVSLSPQARKAWEGYQIQEGVKAALGQRTAEGADIVFIRAETKQNGKNTFTLLKVAAK